MNRLTVSILLQYENTRSFRVVGIVFDNYCLGETVDEVANKDTVGGELLITVIGNTDFAAGHERTYLSQGLAQFLDPFLFLIIPSGVRLVPLTIRAEPRAAPPRVHGHQARDLPTVS